MKAYVAQAAVQEAWTDLNFMSILAQLPDNILDAEPKPEPEPEPESGPAAEPFESPQSSPEARAAALHELDKAMTRKAELQAAPSSKL